MIIEITASCKKVMCYYHGHWYRDGQKITQISGTDVDRIEISKNKFEVFYKDGEYRSYNTGLVSISIQ